jgi:hypothetical protein
VCRTSGLYPRHTYALVDRLQLQRDSSQPSDKGTLDLGYHYLFLSSLATIELVRVRFVLRMRQPGEMLGEEHIPFTADDELF